MQVSKKIPASDVEQQKGTYHSLHKHNETLEADRATAQSISRSLDLRDVHVTDRVSAPKDALALHTIFQEAGLAALPRYI